MRSIGKESENFARRYLEKRGLVFVAANYLCKRGEIDLIMREQGVLVFVEVRFRKNADYGDGAETVTMSKQRKLIRAANHYLLEQKLYGKIDCRFDIIAFAGEDDTVNWLKNAFWEKW